MLRGINAINIDPKGRVAIPKRYQPTLVGQDVRVVITIDTEEKALLIYPIKEWEEIEKKLSTLPSFNKAARRIQRLLIGHATDVELDAQGRILLPAMLRDYAALDKKAVLIGQGNKMELWSETEWQAKRDAWLETSHNDMGDLPEVFNDLAL